MIRSTSVIVVAAIGLGLFLPRSAWGSSQHVRHASWIKRFAMVPYVLVLFVGILALIAVPWFSLVVPEAVYR